MALGDSSWCALESLFSRPLAVIERVWRAFISCFFGGFCSCHTLRVAGCERVLVRVDCWCECCKLSVLLVQCTAVIVSAAPADTFCFLQTASFYTLCQQYTSQPGSTFFYYLCVWVSACVRAVCTVAVYLMYEA